MVQTTTKKNVSGACHEWGVQMFSKEIREFINESRRYQTLFANFEGYHRRIIESDNLTKLDNLIFLSLSSGKDRASLTPDEFTEVDNLTKLMARKILHSSMKFKQNEIHFQVVWIYYFDYLDKEMKATPVFKIYKRACGNEALYIDVTAVEYDSWDNFIMFCEFPISFICIPRRGEYTFRGDEPDGGGLLDLEYICKNSRLLNKSHRSSRPVSQALISKVLRRGIPILKKVLHIVSFMAYDYTDIIPGGKWITVFISIGAIIVNIAERIWAEEDRKAVESATTDFSLMLLNHTEKKPFFLNLLTDAVEWLSRDNSSVDFTNLKNMKRNSIEILKLDPAAVKYSVHSNFAPTSCASGTERSDPDFNNLRRLLLPLLLSYLEYNVKKTRSEESEKCLNNLEKYSSEKVFSELLASSGASTGKEIIDASNLPKHGLDMFGFRVYLLFKYTDSDCRRFLQGLLKSNFTLSTTVPFLNIIFHEKVIGCVIPFSILSQDLAFVVLRLDQLPKVS